jgi:PAS domain S-box-containing protein
MTGVAPNPPNRSPVQSRVALTAAVRPGARRLNTLIGLLTLAVFAMDVLMPWEYAEWILYLCPLLLTTWTQRRRDTMVLAGICTVLVVLGSLLSPREIGNLTIATINRCLSILVLWIAAMLLAKRKQAEAALEASRRLLAETEQMGKVGGWEFDINTKKQNWTEEIYRIHEVDLTYEPNVKGGISFYAPASRPIIEQAVQRAIEQNEPFDVELEIITAKGNQRSIHAIGKADPEHRRVYGFFQDITDSKQVERHLRLLTDTITACLDEIYIFDADTWRFRFVNNGALRNLGYTAAQIQNMTPLDLKPAFTSELFQQLTAPLCRHERPRQMFQTVHRRANGSLYPVDVHLQLMDHAEPHVFLAVIQDLTERKRAEEALRESEERLARFMESATEGFILFDSNLNHLLINPMALEMTRLKQPDVIGKNIVDVVPDILESGRYHAYKEVIRTGKPLHLPDVAGNPLAGGRRVEINAFRVGEGLGITFTDITERKRAEEALERSAQELQAKNAELERFLYGVTHDLKSPLVTIQTFLGFLQEDVAASDAGRIAKNADFITAAANRMTQLMDGLLEISRIGRLRNPPEEVTFRALVDEARGAVAGQIIAGAVAVQVAECEITLLGDRIRLASIWQNLLDNACKFVGGEPAPQIEIGVETRGAENVFFVRDNGVGIDPRRQPEMFGLFVRLDQNIEGTGIGLVLVKRVVELYGGRIWVESTGLGRGACFYFTLPGAMKQTEVRSQNENGGDVI